MEFLLNINKNEFTPVEFCCVKDEFSHPVALEFSVSVLKTSLHR